MPAPSSFSYRNLALLFLMTLLVGVGAYAVAWQFNDGQMGRGVLGGVMLGMALPSLIMGGVMRMFRPDLQKYFAITAAVCLAGGAALLLTV